MSKSRNTALIIGASRGLGLGLVQAYLAKGWHVVATRRGPSAALDALAADTGDRLSLETLDVTDADSLAALREKLAGRTLDLLFASAGIALDPSQKIEAVTVDDFTKMMLTNTLAPMRVIDAFADLVPASGAIAAMTSVLGSVGANTSGGYEAYRASKAALNTLLRSYATRDQTHAILALHPGWVKTDMGGANAAIDVEESVEGMIAVIAAHAGEPGCVFLDYQGKTIVW